MRKDVGYPTQVDFCVIYVFFCEEVELKVDVVYLWVSDTDAFLKKKSEFVPNQNIDSHHAARYRDHEELKYSLRSVMANLPWVNHIYIVTDEQSPTFLNTAHPKVTLVNHTDVFQNTLYPNYSSSAIEWNIVNIPGLSEQFIYLNDDVFIGKPVTKNYFFDKTGRPIWALKRSSGQSNFKAHTNPTMGAHRNTYTKIMPYMKSKIGWKPDHSPMPMLRSDLLELISEFEPFVNKTKSNRFRHPENFVMSRAYPYYFLATNRLGIHKLPRFLYLNEHSIKVAALKSRSKSIKKADKAFNAIAKQMAASFNLNDNEMSSADLTEGWMKRIDEIFPNPCELENT